MKVMNLLKYIRLYQHLKIFKIKQYLIEKNKNMNQNPEIERNFNSRTAVGVSKIGHDSIIIMNWFAYYDQSYHEIINYYDLMACILNCLNEIS